MHQKCLIRREFAITFSLDDYMHDVILRFTVHVALSRRRMNQDQNHVENMILLITMLDRRDLHNRTILVRDIYIIR